MKLYATRTFLLKQEELEGGKKKDIVAHKGRPIEVTEKEAVRFWGDFTDSEKGAPPSDKLKARLLKAASDQKLTRVV